MRTEVQYTLFESLSQLPLYFNIYIFIVLNSTSRAGTATMFNITFILFNSFQTQGLQYNEVELINLFLTCRNLSDLAMLLIAFFILLVVLKDKDFFFKSLYIYN